MKTHHLHQRVGDLIKSLDLVPNRAVWLDPACDLEAAGVVTLFNGAGQDRVEFCSVDILILAQRKLIIIEVEESNVKPLHLFGKFYASAYATHHNGEDISNLPLLFIQVLDTSKINLEESKKGQQWERVERILQQQAEEWNGRPVKYKLLWGRAEEFGARAGKGEELLGLVRGS